MSGRIATAAVDADTMVLEGLDTIGASLQHRAEIDAFAQAHWARQPWLRDVAARTRQRLERR